MNDVALPIPGRFPGAEWRPLDVNYIKGGNSPRLLIVHHMEGTLAGTDEWFRNPQSQVSAHFGLGLNGELIQWVNTQDTAWHAAAANDHSIGVECEGFHTEPLTSQQLDLLALVFEWAHREYPDIHTWLNTRPDTGSGLSWHGLGGQAWGDHPNCPGIPAVHQLGEILQIATAEHPVAAQEEAPATATEAVETFDGWEFSTDGARFFAELTGTRTFLEAGSRYELEAHIRQLYPGTVHN